MEKKCSKCGKIKNIVDFATQTRGLYGKASICKKCKSDYYKEYHQRPEVKEKNKIYIKQYAIDHKEHIAQKEKEWGIKNKAVRKVKNQTYYLKNIERLRKNRKNRDYLRRYGIGFREKEKIFYDQKEKCLICEKKLNDIKKSHLDHSHSTGKIRGILCASCNWWVGFFEKRKELFIRIKKYLVH